MPPNDHQQLFIQLQTGDENAFEQLYSIYKPPALTFCQSMLKDTDEAESIVQDVFMRLWDRRSRLNTNCEFKAYLFSSLKNRVFDYFREVKKNEKAKQHLWEKIEEEYEYNENNDDAPNLEPVKKAIENLPDGRKKILQLRFQDGKSYKEIGEQLNISSNTVKNQLIKAKKYLKDLSIHF